MELGPRIEREQWNSEMHQNINIREAKNSIRVSNIIVSETMNVDLKKYKCIRSDRTVYSDYIRRYTWRMYRRKVDMS